MELWPHVTASAGGKKSLPARGSLPPSLSSFPFSFPFASPFAFPFRFPFRLSLPLSLSVPTTPRSRKLPRELLLFVEFGFVGLNQEKLQKETGLIVKKIWR